MFERFWNMQNKIETSRTNYITVKQYLNEILLKKVELAFKMLIKGKNIGQM